MKNAILTTLVGRQGENLCVALCLGAFVVRGSANMSHTQIYLHRDANSGFIELSDLLVVAVCRQHV